jgi:hypothetical protein
VMSESTSLRSSQRVIDSRVPYRSVHLWVAGRAAMRGIDTLPGLTGQATWDAAEKNICPSALE